MIRASVILLGAIAIAGMVTPARAEDGDTRPCAAEADAVKRMKNRDPSLTYPRNASAKKQLEVGRRAFGVGDYEKAIEAYTAAGLDDDAPIILYNLGQTHRAAKDYEKAIRQYQLFLERGRPGSEVRALVQCHIDTMRREMESAASTAPLTGPAPDDPIPGSTVAADDGREDLADDRLVDIEPGSRWTSMRRAAVGVGGIGVAAIAAGIVFGLQAQDYKDQAAAICPSDPCGRAVEANVLSGKADTRATLANVSFGTSAALLAGAAILWYVGAPSSGGTDTDRGAFMPQLSPTFAGIAFEKRF
jgi:tetratricopeptide (TPR) repeat protein